MDKSEVFGFGKSEVATFVAVKFFAVSEKLRLLFL